MYIANFYLGYLTLKYIIIYRKAIISVMVGILNGSETTSMLFYCKELTGSANGDNMVEHFNSSLNLLFNNSINYKQIHLLITDQVNYNLTFGKKIKHTKLFPKENGELAIYCPPRDTKLSNSSIDRSGHKLHFLCWYQLDPGGRSWPDR